METPLPHRDAAGGLFIGASIPSFALMNSAPAELLHLLAYAALQPFSGLRRSPARRTADQKKRRQQRRRWNTVSGQTNPFSKNTLPCPLSSGSARKAVWRVQVVYCPSIFLFAFLSSQLRFDFVECLAISSLPGSGPSALLR
ncbi:hypothetical protein [Lacisediminimonas sp.]|uniref:hypothetical protein n=1 Tax=Lacisediminimonas sp. TaxID=3060582 RepID=UPI00272BA899|nr:hypothetical protein [Lacisediminimonas sp.]